jgi:hypothetical protein
MVVIFTGIYKWVKWAGVFNPSRAILCRSAHLPEARKVDEKVERPPEEAQPQLKD